MLVGGLEEVKYRILHEGGDGVAAADDDGEQA
jgi:hypothetical protein